MTTQSNQKYDFFIHPLPLGAVILTAVNDHYLKYQFPGLISGKLSDFAGLFFFPLFLSALILVLSRTFGQDKKISPTLLLVTIAFTDILFIAFKLSPSLCHNFAEWFSEFFFPIAITPDPSDLLALLSSFACYFFGKEYL
ncbi:MAG: hypothetical protein AB7O96_05660 [Pseudobdellovibrionaceae bacterium]